MLPVVPDHHPGRVFKFKRILLAVGVDPAGFQEGGEAPALLLGEASFPFSGLVVVDIDVPVGHVEVPADYHSLLGR